MRPLLLYENALEGATLTPSSTATGYDVEALKNRRTDDTWKSNAAATHTITAQLAAAMTPTAFAFTKHDLTLEASGSTGSEDFTTVESPLATGWTNVGDQALQATGGYATDAAQIALAVGEFRHYVRSGGDAWSGLGAGFAQAKIQFSATGTPSNIAGVSARDSSTGAFIGGALTQNTNGVGVWLFDATGTLVNGTVNNTTIAAATDYVLQMTLDEDGVARCYVDGVLITTYDFAAELPVGFAADQQGIWQWASTPASNTARWDDFKSGFSTDPDAVVGPVILRGGTDGATWPYERLFFVPSPGTFIAAFDDAASYEYWQWEFPQSASRALEIASLALGRRLDFTESMAAGFDPSGRKLVTHQSRSNSGSYLGSVRRYAMQSVSLRFGPAGLSTVDFFNLAGVPSWSDFLESTWEIGRAFWFAWDLTQRPLDMWFCMVPDKASTSAPFITPIRRGWKITWDVLVEQRAT